MSEQEEQVCLYYTDCKKGSSFVVDKKKCYKKRSKMMGTNNCLVLGEVGVGDEGDQASSGTHPGLPLNQSPPNQVPDQMLPARTV